MTRLENSCCAAAELDASLPAILPSSPVFDATGDRLPMRSRSSGLSGRGYILVITGTWGFTPSFHITGLQPANLAGPKVRHVIAWAGASPTSAGPGQPSPQTSPAL